MRCRQRWALPPLQVCTLELKAAWWSRLAVLFCAWFLLLALGCLLCWCALVADLAILCEAILCEPLLGQLPAGAT